MIDLYEIHVGVWDVDHTYNVEHRASALPEPAVLRLLLDEARSTFTVLYDEAPDSAQCDVYTLTAEERKVPFVADPRSTAARP